MAIHLDLRRRIVDAYTQGLTASYTETAELFGVGHATVNRLLRRQRETGDVVRDAVGGNRARVIDLDWLRAHAVAHPDARLRDRVEAWEQQSGRRVHLSTMGMAMKAIEWTHKKNSGRSRT